ncbi:hypothetical protein [Azospirillum sp.]|uniref:hypothetical protein n=1 Tax=Azospirillum sp. TaxID=34012 RepID=UPI003D73F40E
MATRTEALIGTRGTAPRAAGALLTAAGALLAVTLTLASLRGGIPLGPLVMWLAWMALLGGAALAVLAVRRSRRPMGLGAPAALPIDGAGDPGYVLLPGRASGGTTRSPSRTA